MHFGSDVTYQKKGKGPKHPTVSKRPEHSFYSSSFSPLLPPFMLFLFHTCFDESLDSQDGLDSIDPRKILIPNQLLLLPALSTPRLYSLLELQDQIQDLVLTRQVCYQLSYVHNLFSI